MSFSFSRLSPTQLFRPREQSGLSLLSRTPALAGDTSSPAPSLAAVAQRSSSLGLPELPSETEVAPTIVVDPEKKFAPRAKPAPTPKVYSRRFIALPMFALDIGTENSSLVLDGYPVLTMPTYLTVQGAIDDPTSPILAFGQEAKNSWYKPVGQGTHRQTTINVMKSGEVRDVHRMTQFLKFMLKKYQTMYNFKFAKCDVVFGVPNKSDPVATSNAHNAIVQSFKPKGVYVIDEGRAAALGTDADFTSPHPTVVIDIGGGTTDMVVVSKMIIVDGGQISVPGGGRAISEAIQEKVMRKYGIPIGGPTAERIKECIASATEPEDDDRSVTCDFYSIGDQKTKEQTFKITAREVYKAINPHIKKEVAAFKTMLSAIPKEFSQGVFDKGAYLSGGGSRLKNLGARYLKDTDIETQLCEDPENGVVNGLLALTRNREILKARAMKV